MIYLDNNATTCLSRHVVEAMSPYFQDCYFNASSSTSAFTGADKPRRNASAALKDLLNAEDAECFVFTSGATESNNWIFSSILQGRQRGRVIISTVEHSSVAEPASCLTRQGFEVVEIPVSVDGVVDMDRLSSMLSADTVLVSIMAANNETGTLQPLNIIGKTIRRIAPFVLFHTDATQALGKVSIDLQGMWADVDVLSFSAHKFHGPKGIGGLYIRPGVHISPMIVGGGQERGFRSGTTNTPALAGLAAAARGSMDEVSSANICVLRDCFEKDLRSVFPSVIIHATSAPRLSNTSCFSLPGIVGEDLALALAVRGIIVGTGSACSSGSLRPPKTLLAMGVDYDLACASIRISLSAYTTKKDLSDMLRELVSILERRDDLIGN